VLSEEGKSQIWMKASALIIVFGSYYLKYVLDFIKVHCGAFEEGRKWGPVFKE
jgi:hypothetical protein